MVDLSLTIVARRMVVQTIQVRYNGCHVRAKITSEAMEGSLPIVYVVSTLMNTSIVFKGVLGASMQVRLY